MQRDPMRNVIQTKIADGRLPHDHIAEFWVAFGAGETCDACEHVIPDTDLIYEAADARKITVQFHPACFDVWNDERRRANPADASAVGEQR
jgi:hypothetical protein